MGFIVERNEVSTDPAKIKTIASWPVPTTLQKLQTFLGFANFYRRFIARYAEVTAPMTELLKEGSQFKWTEGAQHAFKVLKTHLLNALILRHYDLNLRIKVEINASQFGVLGILSQLFKDKKWHSIAFTLYKLQLAERNYKVYN